MPAQATSPPPPSVAVIGAGLAGLACGRALADRGHRVTIFEKSRGAGGRMSTRRAQGLRFDHGAQYFTARDPRFRHQVEAWRERGLVAPWEGRITVLGGDEGGRSAGRETSRFVGVPGMSAVCRHLATDLDVAFECRVEGVTRRHGRWHPILASGATPGGYDVIVVSAPAPQTADLLARAAPRLAERAARVETAPCWAVMAAWHQALDTGFDAAFVHGSPLSWIARDSSKPSRPPAEAWVLHAGAEWTRRHLDLPATAVARRLLGAFRATTGLASPDPEHLGAHLWRFALPEPLPEPCLFDAGLRVAACGDWCGGPRVEGAYLSGMAAAERISSLPGNED